MATDSDTSQDANNPAPKAAKSKKAETAKAAATSIDSAYVKNDSPPIDKLFRACTRLEGSDLHLKVGKPAIVRIKGVLRQLESPPIESEEMKALILAIMNDKARKDFKDNGGADFAHTCMVDDARWRFRVNVLQQMGEMGLVARRVSNFIPDFEGLFLPPIMEELCKFHQGMVLLSGPTGSGKTTTIASMLNWVNRNYRKHILTLEDPVEFVYTEDKCLINQREVGLDVVNFDHGMRQAVREDPDIMLLGEMRDHETFLTAIQAAETGHLVFGTIHASGCPETISRIIDLFPEEQHASLRTAIAMNLKGVVAQKLLKSIRPDVPRVPCVEVMTMNSTIQKLILESMDNKLADAIRIGAQDGMQDFTMSLKQLIDDELIDRATAFEVAPSPDALKMALKGIDVKAPGIL